MPYTPPAVSPLNTSSTPSLPSISPNAPSNSMLPPPAHPQSATSTILYMNGPSSSAVSNLPRSTSFLHKQPRSSPQKPHYYTQQNRQMFSVSTVASANAELASASPLIHTPEVSQSLEKSFPKPSARHIESSEQDDDEDRSSANTSTDDEFDDDADTIVAGGISRRIKNLAALHEAVLQMPPQRRQASPTRSTFTGTDSAPLSPKSSNDYSVVSSVLTSSFEDSDDEDTPVPRMVRKKSGELVKPSLKSSRPSSVPSTPTYPKNVHFDTHLEHVRHFLQAEKPLAVSNQASPVDEKEDEFIGWKPQRFVNDIDDLPERSSSPFSMYDWELVLPNFPDNPNQSALVFVERVFLSPDKRTLLGHVSVKNMAFNKWVAAKFTVDYWKTVSEVGADYTDVMHSRTRPPVGYDRFTFSIKLQDFSKLENKTLFFCVRYNVNGQEFWDSNDGRNYQVEFKRKMRNGGAVPRRYSYDRRLSETDIEPSLFSVSPSFLSSTESSLPTFKPDGPAARVDTPNSHGAKVPRPDALDYSFDSIYTTSKHSDLHLFTSLSDTSLSSKIKTSRPPTPVELVAPAGRPFNSRYDFRVSLNAVLASSATAAPASSSSHSSSPETVVGDAAPASASSKHGFAFGRSRYKVINNKSPSHSANGSGEMSPDQVRQPRASGPSSADMRHVNKQLASMKLHETPATVVKEKPSIDSTSYQDFLDNYCFFQGPQRGRSLQSSTPTSPTLTQTYTRSTPRFYIGPRSSSPSPDDVSLYESPVTETPSQNTTPVASVTPTATPRPASVIN
ncbi:putative phosphatase regulatory subunit-domain-containing protein [Lipomyces arxii]|uniref:putative phosphatase regulatory subunit-domain-containing protein n=1 Tax=Lipomyces arxii TaxID=56418 RepID=UPI0034CE8732